MKIRNKNPGLIGLAFLVITGSAGAQEAEFRWSGTVAQGGWAEIRNVVGDVNVASTSGSEVEIVATKSGRRGDFDLVDIVLVEERNGIIVCVLYPARSRRGRWSRRGDDETEDSRRTRRNACRPGSQDMDVDVSVDFEVLIPDGINIKGLTVSGDIEVDAVSGEVVGASVSGDIFISTSGIAEANTVSGSIEVHLGRADWSGELSFHAVSGDVRVYLPQSLNAEVSFQSVTGDMESDFPITIQRRSGFMAGSLRGTIGEGGRRLEITTVSGDALLLREN